MAPPAAISHGGRQTEGRFLPETPWIVDALRRDRSVVTAGERRNARLSTAPAAKVAQIRGDVPILSPISKAPGA
jgi:hypothetical protein